MSADSSNASHYPLGRGKKEPGRGIFVLTLIRLLSRAHVAADVTGLGELLLIKIAMKEDAFGYTKAPTFWDSQLQDELGEINQKTLASVRRKCVDAGWLHYEHGRKGKAGRYFVQIPEWAAELIGKDLAASFDVNITDHPDQECDVKTTSNDVTNTDATEILRSIRDESGTETGRIGNESGSILPSSLSSTISSSYSSEQAEPIPGWEEVEEGLRRLKVAMIGKAVTAARGHGFNPPQVLALIAYLESNPRGCQSPHGAIFNRLVENGAEAVDWDCDQHWPWSHAKRNRRNDGQGPSEDFDAIAKTSVNPVNPEGLARNAAAMAEQDRIAATSLEARFGAELDAMSDADVAALLVVDPKNRNLASAASTARNCLKVPEHERDHAKTRAALLEVIDQSRRRKVVA